MRMEKSRRSIISIPQPKAQDVVDEKVETEEEASARRAQLHEESEAYLGNAETEGAIRKVLDAPAEQAPLPELQPEAGGLFDLNKDINQAIGASGRITDEILESHTESTERLALVTKKEEQMLVKDFKIEDNIQRLHTEQTGERLPHTDRVVRNLERAGLHRDIQSKETKEQVRLAFAAFDADGDGLITRDEFRDIMTRKGGLIPISVEKADELFDAADTSGNGTVEFDEFINAWCNQCLRPPV